MKCFSVDKTVASAFLRTSVAGHSTAELPRPGREHLVLQLRHALLARALPLGVLLLSNSTMSSPSKASASESLQLNELGEVVLAVGQHAFALLSVDQVQLTVALVNCLVGEVGVICVLRAIGAAGLSHDCDCSYWLTNEVEGRCWLCGSVITIIFNNIKLLLSSLVFILADEKN